MWFCLAKGAQMIRQPLFSPWFHESSSYTTTTQKKFNCFCFFLSPRGRETNRKCGLRNDCKAEPPKDHPSLKPFVIGLFLFAPLLYMYTRDARKYEENKTRKTELEQRDHGETRRRILIIGLCEWRNRGAKATERRVKMTIAHTQDGWETTIFLRNRGNGCRKDRGPRCCQFRAELKTSRRGGGMIGEMKRRKWGECSYYHFLFQFDKIFSLLQQHLAPSLTEVIGIPFGVGLALLIVVAVGLHSGDGRYGGKRSGARRRRRRRLRESTEWRHRLRGATRHG